MILEWGLILSVTSVSVTMLMMIGTYIAILDEAQSFYSVDRTNILLLINIFNIGYIFITPFIFNIFNKYYVSGILISTVATGIAAVGRYLAEQDYTLSLIMTTIVAVAHIPIITAPYGLLKLFPDWQKGYAASIPLFLPVLGINFCILYGMGYIAGQKEKAIEQIKKLNGIIALVGVLACTATITLTLLLKKKIETQESQQPIQVSVEQSQLHEEPGSTSTDVERIEDITPKYSKKQFEEPGVCKKIYLDICDLVSTLFSQKRTFVILISWGIIVGINWTYGSLFGIIFDGQNLEPKEVALIGLAANLSSAIFSNLGTFIKNRFGYENISVIQKLNYGGILAGIIIFLSRISFLPSFFHNLYFLIATIIVLRAGFSSFVSLAFIEMEKDGMKSLIISGFFFWIANVFNLITMEMIDFVNTDISLIIFVLCVIFCVLAVQNYQKMSARIFFMVFMILLVITLVGVANKYMNPSQKKNSGP